MTIFLVLAPVSLLVALIGLAGFWWTVKSGQYEDPVGDASRILFDGEDPLPDPTGELTPINAARRPPG